MKINSLLRGAVAASLILLPAFTRAVPVQSNSWDVTVLDRILAAVPPGRKLAQVGDMQILVSRLTGWRDKLAGKLSPQLAFDGVAAKWPGGVIPFTFGGSVSAAHQQVFRDCAAEWATFANLHFAPRTTQTNYVTVQELPSLEGGQSAVGMVGGQQFLSIGPGAWNHETVCHELGHTLGLVHEHQRADRDNYVTILTNNILPGYEGDFVKLGDSQSVGPYDFLSVMHYRRDAFSANGQDTIEPLPAFQKYLDVMGHSDPVLSQGDRAGMAAVYGPGPTIDSVVTNTLDSGPGSLRAALYYAFDHPDTTITFDIPTSDPGYSNHVFNIQPTDELPELAHATVIDGGTEPTHSNPDGPAILLNGAQAPPPDRYPSGLRITGTNCVVRLLIINGFAADSIRIDGTNATGNTVGGCYLGTDATGSLAVSNGLCPVEILNGASSNLIGGLTAADRNVISGSHYQGLAIRDPGTRNNVVEGNYIGLNAAGTAALSNTWSGVALFNGAQSNLVGGAVAGARNVISGNGLQGVTISDSGSSGNRVADNYIGVGPSGNEAIPNGWEGVQIFGGAAGNIVGGPGGGNVISGNQLQGVAISGTNSTGNLIEGNFIGLDADGTGTVSNGWSGVELFGGASENIIDANLISGNGNYGVLVSDSGTGGNAVQGNFIGVDLTGNAALPNGYSGIGVFNGAQSNRLGGPLPGEGNVISGNNDQGVALAGPGTSGNVVAGNYIGVNATGATAVPNGWSGVEFFNGAQANVVGGGIGARNVISGNGNYGVAIDGGSAANVIEGNTIGLDASGSASVPNAWGGVALWGGAQANQIGGVQSGNANFIAHNQSAGVQMFDAGTTNNSVRGNSMFGNGAGGIVLNTGANRSAAAPMLISAVLGLGTTISGSLNSLPLTRFHLDFYASPPPAASAQAMTFLGSQDIMTDGAGLFGFSTVVATAVPAGDLITATATDAAGNTSPLSAAVTVTTTDSVGDGIPDAWREKYFAADGSQAAATADPDGDGMNNYEEFVAGTNPTNAASVLHIGPVSKAGADINIVFPSVPGIVYRLQARNQLATGGWSTLADQVLRAGGLMQLTEPGVAALPKRFYRLEVLR